MIIIHDVNTFPASPNAAPDEEGLDLLAANADEPEDGAQAATLTY